MAADVVQVSTPPRCVLDSDGCVTLRDILTSFNAPINEEHAWALYYQCAKCIAAAVDRDRARCLLVAKCEHIFMHKDGHVHENTVFAGGGSEPRVRMSSAQEAVFSLGLAVFGALDFGLDVEEERHLSDDLDRLIRHMTAADEETPKPGEMDDEGIERDAGDVDADEDPALFRSLLDSVIERCVRHAGSKSSAAAAELHYRAVCKALVFEALELASFLRKISARGAAAGELWAGACAARPADQTVALEQLQISEWSRLWLQVIQELRHGVNLKKVDLSRARIEFTLTPYEIMMDDIRSRRYTLNKVMVDGDLPHRVKKDAHAVILDFIRSRPPLRKASQRTLAPARNLPATPHERLMNSIKVGRRLRASPAPTPEASPKKRLVTPLTSLTDAVLCDDASTPNAPPRRLIKVDYSMFEDDDDDDDDDDDEPPTPEPAPPASNPWRRTGSALEPVTEPAPAGDCAEELAEEPADEHAEAQAVRWDQLEPYDLATQCSTTRSSMRASMRSRRRHTVVGGNADADVVVAVTRTPSPPPTLRSPADGDSLGIAMDTELGWSRSSLQDEFLHSANWQQAMECLSLTLEEIVHIRSVLTKAELESLPVEGHVKEDVEKRKVCFLCLKTRFGMFGPWGQICKLCQRTVCVKCYSKMRIPTEHFSRVPVFALSPCLSPEDEAEPSSFPRSLMQRLTASGTSAGMRGAGSLPPSPQPTPRPAAHRMTSSLVGNLDGPRSLPSLSPADKRSRLSRSTTMSRGGKENLRGLQMTVCHDCKTMVIQIIRSSRASRTHAIRNLSLNLSPIY